MVARRLSCYRRMSFLPENIPTDILHCIFAQLSDRRDLHAAALVTRICNSVVTPVGIKLVTVGRKPGF